MAVTTTLKLPEKLKSRIARLAKKTQRSAHGLMIDALEREVTRAEHMQSFISEALAADAKVEAGAAVYRAGDVHDWQDRLCRAISLRRDNRYCVCVGYSSPARGGVFAGIAMSGSNRVRILSKTYRTPLPPGAFNGKRFDSDPLSRLNTK